MVFIKKVRSGSKTYYYLVQSYRVGDTVRQKTIKRLTPAEANDPDFIATFLDNNPCYRKSDVKAIIPAAGKALRLSPYAQNLPKGLIPVGNKPILQHTIDCLHACGISEIILVTGFQEEKMRKYFKDEVKFIYNPFYTVSNILASVWFACQEMNSPFLILYGDILFEGSIINSLFQDENDISVAITSSIIDNEAEKVVVKGGYLLEIGKAIPDSLANFEFAGIAKFSDIGARYLQETIEEMAREEGFLDLPFTSAIERLILKGYKICTKIISQDLWIDIDFPKDLLRSEKEILPNLQARKKNQGNSC